MRNLLMLATPTPEQHQYHKYGTFTCLINGEDAFDFFPTPPLHPLSPLSLLGPPPPPSPNPYLLIFKV